MTKPIPDAHGNKENEMIKTVFFSHFLCSKIVPPKGSVMNNLLPFTEINLFLKSPIEWWNKSHEQNANINCFILCRAIVHRDSAIFVECPFLADCHKCLKQACHLRANAGEHKDISETDDNNNARNCF